MRGSPNGATAGLPIGPILIPRPVLGSPAQTTRVNVLDFFVKPKNGISASYAKRR